MIRTKSLTLMLLFAMTVCLSFILKDTDAAGLWPTQAGAAKVESSILKFDRLDSSVDTIIPADAKLERVATGFTWVEGPVWV
ncbi:MAG: hypothetical protein WCA11_14060, partial [Terracidiphilus sp.]